MFRSFKDLYKLIKFTWKRYGSKLSLPAWATKSTENKVLFGLLSFFVASFLMITSIVWFPIVFVISLPVLILAVGAFLVYSYIMSQIRATQLAIKASVTTFGLLNDLLTLFYPKSLLTIGTAGYADSSESGIFVKEF